jgi:putative tryptophan/tyrosine transport system substrate-binding protein
MLPFYRKHGRDSAVNRRSFITLLGGAATWPFAVRAQQTAMPLVGFLDPRSPDAVADRLRAFRQGLKGTGYVEGENVTITYRFAENQIERLHELAADLVRRQVAVIVTSAEEATLVAKAATTTVPILFTVSRDPVSLGLVANLAHPGGNVTGVNFLTSELVAKRLELLRELVPRASRVAVLVNPANATIAETTLRDVEPAARAMGLSIQILNASTGPEIDAAFATLVRERVDALLLGDDPFFNSRRVQFANLAAHHSIPMATGFREIAEAGGLMSYGANILDAYREVGLYTGRILKGTKPADLPVVQSSELELVINHSTARMLGITVPDKLLATADEVIE